MLLNRKIFATVYTRLTTLMWDMMCFLFRRKERTCVRLVRCLCAGMNAAFFKQCEGSAFGRIEAETLCGHERSCSRVWWLGPKVGTRAMADSKQSFWWCTAAPLDTDALVTRLTHHMHARDAVAGQGPYEFEVAPAIDRFASLAPKASATTWGQLEVVSALTVRIPPSAVSGHSAKATSGRRMALLFLLPNTLRHYIFLGALVATARAKKHNDPNMRTRRTPACSCP